MAVEDVILPIITSVLTGILTILWAYYKSIEGKRSQKRTSEKIDSLARILRDAGSEIAKLEKEVGDKSKKLGELESVSQRLETLVSLKEEQVDAIRQQLKSTLKESNRSNRLWTIVIGAMWFILGLVVRGFLGF